TLLGIMIFRLYWRWWNPKPELPETIPLWQRKAANLSHYMIYLAFIIMIASGWAKSTSSGYIPNFYGLFNLPMPFIPLSNTINDLAKAVHNTTVWVIIALLGLHILAALYHHFVRKDNVFKRMLPTKATVARISEA
ncbi:MAG: cytochrome b, partial [Legionella sp.]